MLAYIDSITGLIPCRVLDSITRDGATSVQVQVTASRPGWRRGEVLHLHLTQLVSRKVRRSGGALRVTSLSLEGDTHA